MFPHIIGIRADRKTEVDFIGDDVVLRAALNVADSDDRRVARLDLARHDGLQAQDGPGGDDDGINRVLGHGAVPAAAVDGDIHGVGVGRSVARYYADLAGGKLVAGVQRHADRGLGKAREESVLNHGFGALHPFLGRLPDQHQRAMPLILGLHHDLGGADQGGHVNVMPAGMHDRDLVTGIVLGRNVAGVRQAGLLRDGQGIKFGAQHDDRSAAVAQDGNHARATHLLRDFVAEPAQLCRQLRRRVDLMQRQLGVLMQILVECLHSRVDRLHLSAKRVVG